MLLLDLLVRFRSMRTFSAFEWTSYAISVVLMTCLWCLLFRGLQYLHKRKRKIAYWLCVALMSLANVSVLGLGYSIYMANGDLPDLFLLSFIRCETENAIIMFRDSIGALHAVMLLLGTALLSYWIHCKCRKQSAFRHPQNTSFWLPVLLSSGAMWFSWTFTAGQGQCFVPVVRIPMIVAVYAQNEIKGINPKPIYLPPREPITIASQIPSPAVNVLLILNESLRRNRLSIYGNTRNTTPFINQWAARYPDRFFPFDRAYTNSTTTLLSVPSIFTGIAPVQPLYERIKAPLLWQWAKAANMQTFYHTSHYLDWLGLGAFITTPPPDTSWDMRRENLPPYRDMGCDDHYTVARAIAHIESLADSARPFLGVIHLNTSHYPYNTAKPYQQWSGSDLDLYDNTILETDSHTRRLIETLERTGQIQRTVILFASDHGEAFQEHGYTAHFYCHFAETITVPLWIWLPESFASQRNLAHLKENRHVNTQNLDILPTILDCIGAWDHHALAELRTPMMGSSLFRKIDPLRDIYITNTDESMPSIIGLSSVTGNFHYMLRTSGSSPLEDLYNIADDPLEVHNLWPRTADSEKHSYRSKFFAFPVSSTMMKKAFPHLSGESTAQTK
jgi:glucan phosphoethanolaminetransferase (alkaline phosphatase superfamily)